MASVLGASAVDFPGMDPGTATAQTDGLVYTISNQVITVSFRVSGGQLVVDSIEDKVAGQVYAQLVVSPVFKMTISTAAGNVSFTVESSTDLMSWAPCNGERFLDGHAPEEHRK